jgi:hypothetical protein
MHKIQIAPEKLLIDSSTNEASWDLEKEATKD